MKTRTLKFLFATALTAVALPVASENDPALPAVNGGGSASPPPPAVPAAPAEEASVAVPKLVKPAEINLPSELAGVVRLAESGADEGVILAYVQKNPPPARITAEQIVYLQDLGITPTVTKALIDRSQVVTAQAGGSPPAPAAPAPAQPPGTVSDFYDNLAPYGGWYDLPPYGWCWQPSILAVNPGWSPYCDGGDWLWTDCGWYWNSLYSWGWGPFHYGRWFCHPHRGWFWCPDVVWGPSWVCWRHSAGFCGWAPLPPGAGFVAGVGLTHHGVAVGVGFGFGLGAASFTFVDANHFTDRHLAAHRLTSHERDLVFNKTAVNNRFEVGANQQIINRGLDRAQIESITHTRFHEVAVRDVPHTRVSAAAFEHMARTGTSPVVNRPAAGMAEPRTPAPSQFEHRGVPAASSPVVRETPRTSSERPIRAEPPASAPAREPFVQPSHPAVSEPAPHSAPPARGGAPSRHESSSSWPAPVMRSTPQWSPAANHVWSPPAQSWSAPHQFSAPTFSRPAPSYGGGGGRSFGGGGGGSRGGRGGYHR